MTHINIEIEAIENGWIIEDSYFGEKKYLKDIAAISNEANKRLLQFQKQELEE